ncbi:MAG: hypothetical protein M1445_01050 [Bacteroidetes bacterium]|nr:hypothetical protein [Bacteroidota bacterium]
MEKYKYFIGVVLIPLLPFIYQIISKWNDPKTELSATIECINNPIPSKLTDNSSYLLFDAGLESLFNSLQNETGQRIPSIFKNNIDKLLRESFRYDEIDRSSLRFGTFGKLIISNLGDKEIRDIEVSAPHRTYYEFIKNDGSLATGLFNDKIGVGSLRSSENVLVRLWGMGLNGNNVLITFPDGAFKPKELVKMSGFSAFLAKYFSGLPDILYLIFLLVYFIFIGYSILNAKGYKITKITRGES